MSTGTLTRSATSSFTDVKSVTRGLQADLFQVLDHYGYFAEQRAVDIVHDVRLMIDEDILASVELVWCRRGTDDVITSYKYDVVRGALVGANSRPGGIPYDPPLASADFSVIVHFNATGRAMSWDEINGIGTRRPWGAAAPRSYGTGGWTVQRTYASNGLGLQRSVYR